MSNTLLTFRLPEDLAEWLSKQSQRTGVPVGKIIREQLEKARQNHVRPLFMRHAGKIRGPRDLSSRKGFSR